MQIINALGLISFVFAGMASSPLGEKPFKEQSRRADVWPAALTNVLGNDRDCGHAMRLLVREEGRELSIWDTAARRPLVVVPRDDDGSASLETYSAALGARLTVTVPAGTGPREFEVQKKWPVVCVYEVAPH